MIVVRQQSAKKQARLVAMYFRVRLQDIALVRSILEGYDGLAVLIAPDPNRGEIEWLVAEGRETEATALASRLEREGLLLSIPRPADWPIRV